MEYQRPCEDRLKRTGVGPPQARVVLEIHKNSSNMCINLLNPSQNSCTWGTFLKFVEVHGHQ